MAQTVRAGGTATRIGISHFYEFYAWDALQYLSRLAGYFLKASKMAWVMVRNPLLNEAHFSIQSNVYQEFTDIPDLGSKLFSPG